jgi:HlyD family secretion protein
VGFALFLALRNPGEKLATGPVVRYAKVTAGPMSEVLRISGTTHATEFVNVITPRQQAPEASNHMLLQTLVPSGTMVKKGQTIAVIDATALRDHVDDLADTIRQAHADVEKRKAEQQIEWETYLATLRQAKADMDKAILDARAAGVKTDIERQLLELNVKQTTAHYKQLSADMKTRQAENQAEIKILQLTEVRHRRHRDRHARDLDAFTVKSPMNGMSVSQTVWYSSELREIRQGDQVYPGLLIVRVVNPAKMQVEGRVNQAEAMQVRVGQPVSVTLDAFPNEHLKAHVEKIGALASGGWREQDFIRNIPVIVKLDQMNRHVIPDLTAAADISVGRLDRALHVPRAAIRHDASRAYVLFRDGSRRDVAVGLETNTESQVTRGLREGDEVRIN